MEDTDIYQGKLILSVGASKRVLNKFSEALNNEVFVAQWTNKYNDVDKVTKQYNASDFDIIAFGRDVSDKDRKLFKAQFKSENRDILFVDGLAPITNLLIDQIKLVLKPKVSLLTKSDCYWGIVQTFNNNLKSKK